MLIVEKDALLASYQKGAIGRDVFEHLCAELDERLGKAKSAEAHVPLEEAAAEPKASGA